MAPSREQLTLVRATPAQRLELYRGLAACFAGGATVDEFIAQQQCVQLSDKISDGQTAGRDQGRSALPIHLVYPLRRRPADDGRTYVPVSDTLSTESRGSIQLDVRPLLIKEPGQPIREEKAAHFGRLFVPLRFRGQGLSAAMTRDLRALVQSGALAPPLDSIELFYGQAEPKLSGICALARRRQS